MISLDLAWAWWLRAMGAGTIVLAAGTLALACCRAPVRRVRLATWALGGALLAPALVLVPGLPRWSLATRPAPANARLALPPAVPPAPTPFRDPEPDPARPGGPVGLDPSVPPAPHPQWWASLDPRALVLAAHALVGAAWLAWWGGGLLRLGRLSRSARPVDASVRARFLALAGPGGERVRLACSPRVAQPVTFTGLRPTILLPADLGSGGDAADLPFALAHEWSHVERGDHRAWTLALLAGAAWLPHPLYWHLRRQLHLGQDFLADDRAAAVESPAGFAACLVRRARARRDRSRLPLPALGFGGRPSPLTRRVLMLLADRPPLARRCPPAWTATAAALAALVLVAAAGLRLDAAPPAPAPQVPPPRQPGDPGDVSLRGFKPPAPADLLAAATGDREWSGRVVDQATRLPIVGAAVWVAVERFDPKVAETQPLRDIGATTAADGSYRFVLTATEQADPMLRLRLVIGHPDHIAGHESEQYTELLGRIGRGERPSFDRIELAPARPVEGIVLDPAGSPVAGVKVVARSNQEGSSWGYEAVQTDARGRFRVPVALQGPGVLWILPEHFEPLRRDIAADRGNDLGTFRLGAGVRLRGRVLDVGDRPVGGVFVDAQILDGAHIGRDNPFRHYDATIGRSAATLADGTFLLDPLPPGLVELRVNERRSFPMNFQDDLTERGKPARSEYMPPPGAFLSQEVRIEPGREPGPIAIRAVPNVRLTAQLRNGKGEKQTFPTVAELSGMIDGWAWTGRARPDPAGQIELIVPRGLERARLQVMANQYRKLRYTTGRGAPQSNRLDLPAGALDGDLGGIEVVSMISPVVRVRATDREGRAVAGASVSLEKPIKAPMGGKQALTASLIVTGVSFGSADGKSWTFWADPDVEQEVKVEANGFKPASRRLTLPEGKVEEVAFVLEPR